MQDIMIYITINVSGSYKAIFPLESAEHFRCNCSSMQSNLNIPLNRKVQKLKAYSLDRPMSTEREEKENVPPDPKHWTSRGEGYDFLALL